MKKLILILTLLFIYNPTIALADSIEFMAGINYQKFDDYSDYDDAGVSTKLRYLRYRYGSGAKHGLFINLDNPAMFITIFNAVIGYGIRTSGNFYWDAGAGYAWSPIYGTGPTAIVGFGFKFGSTWNLSFPISVSAFGITTTPMVGYSF